MSEELRRKKREVEERLNEAYILHNRHENFLRNEITELREEAKRLRARMNYWEEVMGRVELHLITLRNPDLSQQTFDELADEAIGWLRGKPIPEAQAIQTGAGKSP